MFRVQRLEMNSQRMPRGWEKRLWPAATGLVTAAACLLILAHAARAAWAQWNYSSLRYGRGAAAPLPDKLRRGEASFQAYPWNYYLCIYLAEAAWHASGSAAESERPFLLDAARKWCERGLALNPYRSQLRWLKTEFLRRESPARALQYWRAYVEWDFWTPHHHAALAELAAEAGDFRQAEESLYWAQRAADYEGVRERVLRMEIERVAEEDLE